MFTLLNSMLLVASGQAQSTDSEPTDAEEVQEPATQESAEQEPQERGPANPFAHIDDSERLTVNFKDQELSAVLEMFSTNYNLNLVYGEDVDGLVTINLYEAPIASALLQILATNGYSFVIQDGFIRVLPVDEIQVETFASGTKFDPLVIYLDHVTSADILVMVAPLMAGNESMIAGPSSEEGLQVTDQLGGNAQASREMVVLYAGPETTKRVQDLLEKVDVPPLQVLVEATILSISLTESNKLGVDFTAFNGIDFQAMGGLSNITDGVDTDQVSVGQNNWLMGARTSGFTDPSSEGLHVGILRNQLGVFIEALESVGNATVLSNPQVLTVNRHLAEVLIGQRLPYFTTTSNQTATLQSVNFLEVGTSLIFRPFISGDGYVRLEIQPKSSTGVINAQGLPEETTTQVSANVLVRSGNTVVIGGLMETREFTDTTQVPLLGSLPFFGGLFRSEAQREVKNEIIVLLTPYILDDGDLENRAAAAKKRFDASRAQLAASHHGYLRPSYARKMYREAALELAKNDPEAALAKAEWGLLAMPADPDLALLAEHCHDELLAQRFEENELRDAMEILNRQENKQ
jgi:type IV pilus assembly protein PilQ